MSREIFAGFWTFRVSLGPKKISWQPNVNSNVRMFSFQSGVRFTVTREKLSPFAKVLIGGTSMSANGTGTYLGVNQSAGGVLRGRNGRELSPIHRLGWKFEGDFL